MFIEQDGANQYLCFCEHVKIKLSEEERVILWELLDRAHKARMMCMCSACKKMRSFQ